LSEFKEKIDRKKEEVAQEAKSLGKLRMARNKLAKNLSVIKNELDQQENTQVTIKEQRKHLDQSLKQSKTKIDKLQKEAEAHQEQESMLTTQLKDVEAALVQFEKKMADSENSSLKLNAAQIRTYEQLKNEAGMKTGPLRLELDRTKHTLRSKEVALNEAKQKLQSLEDQIMANREPLAKLSERKSSCESQIRTLSQELDQNRQTYEEQSAQRRESANERNSLRSRLDSISQELQNARADRQESERDLRMNDCLDYLKKVYPTVRGRVSDLCKPVNRKYNTAVVIGMGRNFDAIVVDDEATAIECIQYFRDQRAGVVTVIPLDTIQVSPPRDSLRRLPGSFKLLIDVIQYEESLYRAFQYACGNTLVCESMDEARRLCYGGSGSQRSQDDDEEENSGYKVVTLQGSLIHKNGNMTGGVAGVVDKSNRWDEQEIRKLKEERDDLAGRLSELEATLVSEHEIGRLAHRISELSRQLDYVRRDLQATNEEIERWKKNLKDTEIEFQSTQEEVSNLEAQMDKASRDVEKIDRQIAKVDSSVFEAFNAEVGVDNIQEYEESRLRNAQESSKKRVELNVLISNLRNQLETLKQVDFERPINVLREKIAKDEKSKAKLAKQEAAVQDEIKKIEERLASGDENHKKLSADIESAQEKVKLSENEVNQLTKKMSKHCLVSAQSLKVVQG
jgi:structural maintenance of chromosome 1